MKEFLLILLKFIDYVALVLKYIDRYLNNIYLLLIIYVMVILYVKYFGYIFI